MGEVTQTVQKVETQLTTPPDDLWWIDEDLFEVHFVARKRGLSLRPRRPRLNPPIDGIRLKPYGEGEWPAMPFSLKSEDHERQKRLRMKYNKWSYFCISRDIAEDMWSDDRWPIPRKAIISHEEFRGWSTASKRAVGTHRPLDNPDVLREAVRRFLQRGAGQVFINWSRHEEILRQHPQLFNIVNPYGNALDEVALPVVRTAPDGILTKPVPEIEVPR